MLTDSVTNDDTGAGSVPTDATGDSCTVQFIEIVPQTRDTDDPCTTACELCDSGDWSDDIKQEYLPVVKQEPHDVSDDMFLFVKCCYGEHNTSIKFIFRENSRKVTATVRYFP